MSFFIRTSSQVQERTARMREILQGLNRVFRPCTYVSNNAQHRRVNAEAERILRLSHATDGRSAFIRSSENPYFDTTDPYATPIDPAVLNDTNYNRGGAGILFHTNIIGVLTSSRSLLSLQITRLFWLWSVSPLLIAEEPVAYTYRQEMLATFHLHRVRGSLARHVPDFSPRDTPIRFSNSGLLARYNYAIQDDLHAKFLPDEKNLDSVPFYGMELEIETNHRATLELIGDIQGIEHGEFFRCKSDGSLSNGFEIVCPPATFGYHQESTAWPALFEKLDGNIDLTHTRRNAGLHIHVSRDSISPLVLGKFVNFINKTRNATFINKIAGRQATEYSRRAEGIKISDAAKGLTNSFASGNRYTAVNTNNFNTVEVRIFTAPLKVELLWANLEFVKALLDFENQTSLAESEDARAFVEFVRKSGRASYPNLLDFMASKSIIKTKKPGKITERAQA